MSKIKMYPAKTLALALTLSSFTASSWATPTAPHSGGEHPATQGDITFLFPTQGSELTQRQFTLLAQFADVPNLHHAHYGIARTAENASKGGFTFPDLTGAATIQLDPASEDGTYFICSYLADINHVHLSETLCVSFELSTSGIITLSPQTNAILDNYTVEIDAAPYGYTSAQLEQLTTQVTIDNQLPIVTGSLPLSIHLANGNHTVDIAMIHTDGTPRGKRSTVAFTVQSQLTTDNLKKLKKLIANASKATSASTFTKLKNKSQKLITSMLAGGFTHPTCESLNATGLMKARALVKKGSTKALQAATKQLAKVQRDCFR
jgi:hypothetical protein